MGNRAYFTIKSNKKNETYYMHWNGGVDTFAPLCKVLFENQVKDPSKVVDFLKAMDVKTEKQNDKDCESWFEENGHYFIDLEKQEVKHAIETSYGAKKIPIFDLSDWFENYLKNSILKEYHEQTRENYWQGIQDEGRKFFGGLK